MRHRTGMILAAIMTGVLFSQMKKRRVGQMHAAGVRVVSGTDGGIAAAKPHGLLPVSVAFLVEGGVSTAAALASATALAAAACGLGDSKGRLRAAYDADLLVVDGDPAGGSVRRRAAPGRSSLTYQPGRRDGPGAAGRPRGSAGLTTETPYTRHAATVP